jgi:hypothetical protein
MCLRLSFVVNVGFETTIWARSFHQSDKYQRMKWFRVSTCHGALVAMSQFPVYSDAEILGTQMCAKLSFVVNVGFGTTKWAISIQPCN